MMMEKCKERILKRINSQYKAAFITAMVLILVGLIVALIQDDIVAGLVIFILITVIALIAALPTLIKYKKSMNVIASTSPTLCTVTEADTKLISTKRMHQVAYFIYDGEKCYAFDYDKELFEIEAGQQIYVWKITKNRYEMVHVE